MATTHALFGALLVAPFTILAPEYAPVAFAAGVSGGVFPDLDLYAEHRKTLHYPIYYTIGAIGVGVVALFVPTTMTIAIGVFLLAAACHSASDALGGGLELRPWHGVSERAVYDHFRSVWIRPRRWIRYDGSPEDFLLAVVLAVPALVIYGGVPVKRSSRYSSFRGSMR